MSSNSTFESMPPPHAGAFIASFIRNKLAKDSLFKLNSITQTNSNGEVEGGVSDLTLLFFN